MNKFKNIKFSYLLLLVFSCFSFNFLKTTTEIETNKSNSKYERIELTDSEILEQKQILENNLPKSINHTFSNIDPFIENIKLNSREMDKDLAAKIIYNQNNLNKLEYNRYYNFINEDNIKLNNKKYQKVTPTETKYDKPLEIIKNEINQILMPLDEIVFIEKAKSLVISNYHETQDAMIKFYLNENKINSNFSGILNN